MENKVSKFFDKYAIDFNAIYGTSDNIFVKFINNYFRKSMKERFIKVIEGCNPVAGKRIIDIGCGAGHYAITLAKNGASYVYGIDFAKGMIELAEKKAKQLGVDGVCEFVLSDFLVHPIDIKFDYAIIMGFMDYIKDPKAIIKKTLSITTSKAFFSFPAKGGILEWQRRVRYKRRCPLFFYNEKQIYDIFNGLQFNSIFVEKIHRDFFVTVNLK